MKGPQMTHDNLMPKQAELLRSRLRSLKRELVALLESNRDGIKPVDLDTPIGRLTRIDAMAQQKMAQASRSLQQQRLSLIEAALKAYDDGEYGTCRVCFDAIEWKRLEARPETPFCIRCQEERESS